MLSIILLAIGLSMDAFSLSLCFGTLNLSLKKMLTLSIIVGLFHFIMPIIGMNLAHAILKNILLNTKYIAFIVFFALGLFMIFDKEENSISKLSNILSLFLFGFLVSIDSFVAGIGLEIIYDNHVICAIIFSAFSALFTLTGLLLGKYLNNKIGKYAKILGGIIIIALSIQYLTK